MASSFHDILAQAAAPDFRTHARTMLLDAESNLAAIEARIAELFLERELERGRIAALKYLAAPIRILPADLLAELFVATALASASEERAAVQLSAVCAYWRQIALRTPRLWAAGLSFKFAKRPAAGYLERKTEVVRRSGAAPLNVIIRSSNQGPWSQRARDPEDGKKLVRLALSTAERWRDLDCSVDIVPYLQPNVKFRFLQKLVLESYGRIEGPAERVSAFSDSPVLSHVEWQTPYLLDHIVLPWNQLTTLVFTHLHPHSANEPTRILDTLSLCSSIVHLQVNLGCWTVNVPEPNTEDIVSLPNLTSIHLSAEIRHLHSADPTMLSPLFGRFAAPTLTELHIEDEEGHTGDYLDAAFARFVTRSPLLVDLEIELCSLSSNEFIAILEAAPRLTRLRVFSAYDAIEDRVLRLLTDVPGTTTAPLAPRLQHITLESIGGEYKVKALLAMLRSRWYTTPTSRVAKLQSFDLVSHYDSPRGYTMGQRAEIDRMEEEGLDISVDGTEWPEVESDADESGG
ncbi:F-box domain-containing protein [Mycena kentingensis (nom. inval.)]|nr:F-box domain-containing protein [Mycena kentingensis (nom. inval.)]